MNFDAQYVIMLTEQRRRNPFVSFFHYIYKSEENDDTFHSKLFLRILVFPHYPGARAISVETVPIRMRSGNQQGLDATYTVKYDHGNEHWLYVFRVFLDGIYSEPPAEALPPLPQVQIQSDDNLLQAQLGEAQRALTKMNPPGCCCTLL